MFKKLYAPGLLFFSLLLSSSFVNAHYNEIEFHDKPRHELIKIIIDQQQRRDWERAKAAMGGATVMFAALALLNMNPRAITKSFLRTIAPF